MSNSNTKKVDRQWPNKPDVKKADIINLFQQGYEKTNSLRIHNNFYGNTVDYYGYDYKVDEFDNDGLSVKSIDTYDVMKHKFVDQNGLQNNWNLNDKREMNITAQIVFPLNDFANNVHERFEVKGRNVKRQNKKESQFSKKQLNKYYKLAAGEKRVRKYIANNSDDENEYSSDEEVNMENEDYQPSDDENDNYLLSKVAKPSYDICSNVTFLENDDVKIIGIATKNGYLNFKLIDQHNGANNDGISLYLKSFITNIFCLPNKNPRNLGLISCTLHTGDLFFIEFFHNPTNDSCLKSQITYKFNILRKSKFQNSAYKDIKYYKKEINSSHNVYKFVIIDRYGNYTNGKIESKETEPNLIINIENCLDDDKSFKGVMFDPMNVEFPYKNIILGPNEETLFLVDNTKIVSLNKTQKSALLIAQFKFWSNIIDCFDIGKYTVLLTNIEIKIFEKTVTDSQVAVLKNVLSIKHYLNLARYDDLSIDVSLKQENDLMLILIKKYKMLYILTIDPQTQELILINQMPILFKFSGMKFFSNDTCSLVGTSLFFLYGEEYERSICSVNIASVLGDNLSLNTYGIINVVLKNDFTNNSYKDLLLLEKFEETFSIKNRVKKAILRGKLNTADQNQTDKVSLEDHDLVEQFADNFYSQLVNRFEGKETPGCIRMSDIEELPGCLVNSNEFYDFNNQFTKTINENTLFRIINFYNSSDVKPLQIWNSQMIMYKGNSHSFKNKVISEYSKSFDIEASDMVYQSLKAWNPNKFAVIDVDMNDSQSKNKYHASFVKKMNTSSSKAIDKSIFDEDTSSYNITFSGISQLPFTQHDIQDNDFMVESTQKMQKPKNKTIKAELSVGNDNLNVKRTREKKTTAKLKETKPKIKKQKKTSGFF